MRGRELGKPSGWSHANSFTAVFGPPNSDFQTLERTIQTNPAVPATMPDALRAEFEKLRVFSDHHILRPFTQFFVRESCPVLKRSFIRGNSLHQVLLTLGPQSKSSCMCLAKTIAVAVETVHAQNIPMCSLTVDNCIISNGSLVIVNFGHEFGFYDSIAGDSTVASLALRGPEGVESTICRPSKELDIWHFGLLLYGLFTGFYPWKTYNYGRIIKQMCSNAVPLDESIDADIASLLRDMFASDPRLRPSATTVRERIETIIQQGNLSACLPRLPPGQVATPKVTGVTLSQIASLSVMARSRGRFLSKHPHSATPDPVKQHTFQNSFCAIPGIANIPRACPSKPIPRARGGEV